MIHPDGIPPALTLENLKALIKSSFQDRSVIFKTHSKSRSKERKISFPDVKHVCMSGRFKKPPYYEREHNNWKYELIGEDLDETETTIVVAVRNDQKLVTVVTCY